MIGTTRASKGFSDVHVAAGAVTKPCWKVCKPLLQKQLHPNTDDASLPTRPHDGRRPAKVHNAPQTVRSGRAMGVAVLSLVLSGGALGAAGFLWWQQQQQLNADHARTTELKNSLASR